jgi:hypothetical protein
MRRPASGILTAFAAAAFLVAPAFAAGDESRTGTEGGMGSTRSGASDTDTTGTDRPRQGSDSDQMGSTGTRRERDRQTGGSDAKDDGAPGDKSGRGVVVPGMGDGCKLPGTGTGGGTGSSPTP